MCDQGHRFYMVSTKPSGRSAVRCRTKTCPVRGMLTREKDAVTLSVSLEYSGNEISTEILLVKGDHSHDSGLVEVCVNQLRQRKLQEGFEEINKPPRELWAELRVEVSQQFGLSGEIFLGNRFRHVTLLSRCNNGIHFQIQL